MIKSGRPDCLVISKNNTLIINKEFFGRIKFKPFTPKIEPHFFLSNLDLMQESS